MSLIDFRVYFPPDIPKVATSLTQPDIKSKIDDVLLRLNCHGFKKKKCELLTICNDSFFPEIFGSEVAVQAEISHNQKGLQSTYQMLVNCWNDVSKWFPSKLKPLLVLTKKESFIKCYNVHHSDIQCSGMAFGTLPFTGEFALYYTLPVHSEIKYTLNFIHDEKKLEVFIEKLFSSDYRTKILISYDNICKIVVEYGVPYCSIHLVMLHPPLFYTVREKRARNGFRYELTERVLTVGNLEPKVIGRSNVIRLKIRSESFPEIISCMHRRCNYLPIMYGEIVERHTTLPTDQLDACFAYFSCRYMVSAIVNRNSFVAEQIRSFFPDSKIPGHIISDLKNEKLLEKSLIEIFFTVDNGHFVNFLGALLALYSYYANHNGNDDFLQYITPPKTRKIRRAILTPTRIMLWPPEIMFENRVIRNFDSDYALRVSFRDDDITRLTSNASQTNDNINFHAIKKPMMDGLKICGRHYRFLGWSNSQIRDHGVWMYAMDNKGNDVNTIRRWMGDFSHIHSVPKYMSRMGQAFSQTESTVSVPLDGNRIRTEEDIEHGCDPLTSKPYCFSDGIGRISKSLSDKVQLALGHDKRCSAFQIRYGGYKGMLVTDPTLKDADIVFRKSMKKFDSPNNIWLEIAKTSAPVPLFLNRPFVTLLDQLGVEAATFLRLQEEMLQTLTDMLIYEEKAAQYLTSKIPGQTLNVNDIVGCGIGLNTDPFFHSILLALHRHYVYKVKTRANIAIDPSKGRNMLGVLDETGKLQYGQVFVQFTIDITSGETTEETTIIKGTVLVTKNPCMFPGDIRKFQAVDVPELHHITDCIVFPQNGPRPHPNEMAGSDLDGDEYAVLWDEKLLFRRCNAKPADFPTCMGPSKLFIQDADIIDFLVEYIKNDQVGMIASAHLALADNFGIDCTSCLSLAKKFSVAVDFPKTGASSSNFRIDRHEKPERFPDFMQKYWKFTYRSKQALGKLFRVCKDFETENLHACVTYSDIKPDPDLIVPDWLKYKDCAIENRNKYNSLLSYILQNHGVQHEAEAFSGAFTKLHCRYFEMKDKAEIEKVVLAKLKSLCTNMRKEFFKEFKVSSEVSNQLIADTPNENLGVSVKNKMLQEMFMKASAWYMVTYSNPNPDFLSFPWLVSNILSNIKIRVRSKSSVTAFSPLVAKLDASLMSMMWNHLPELPTLAIQAFASPLHIACSRMDLELAFRFVMFWATDNKIKRPVKILLDIFLCIAEKEGYIGESSTKKRSGEKTAATLFLAFLRQCAKFSFCQKKDALKILGFEVFKSKHFGKIAMQTYHQIAITGTYINTDRTEQSGMIEMKPEYMDCGAYTHLLHEENLRKVEKLLQSFSGAESVRLRDRKTTKKIIISANGTQQAINMLRRVLGKGIDTLMQAITTGAIEI